MSIDRLYKVAGEKITKIDSWDGSYDHTVRETAHGIEHLYIFENAEATTAMFERWRRQPCESIVLTTNGVQQPGGRLPLVCKDCKQEIPLGFAHLFEDEIYHVACLDCACVVDEDGSTIEACALHPQGGSPKGKAIQSAS